MTPQLTGAGKNILMRALAGETINFTKIQLGNGPAQVPATATALENPLLTVQISDIDIGDEYVTLTASFTNASVTNGFHITEAGFFVEDPDDNTNELLYAIGNEDESSADFVPANTNRLLEMQYDALIFIGDAENVTAAISGSLVYATKEEFDVHKNDNSNPHNITKEQVGLGNVPNVTTNDQTPTYTDILSLNLQNLVSGEKMGNAFAKIKLAISILATHLSRKNNPHNVTATQVGAASKTHTHGVSDINSGVLPVVRGGTGKSSMEEFASELISQAGFSRVVTGTYTGSGNYGSESPNVLSFTTTPKLLMVMPVTNESDSTCNGFNVINGVNDIVIDNNSQDRIIFNWNTKKVEWYSTSADYQQNTNEKEYCFVAII